MLDKFELTSGVRVKRVYDLAQRKLVSSVAETTQVAEVVSAGAQVTLPMTYVSVGPPPTVSVIG